MENQKKNRRAFFKDMAKVCVASSFISKSALSFSDLFTEEGMNSAISSEFPVCLNVSYSFTGNKTEQEIYQDLNRFGAAQELKKIITDFENSGKLSPIRHAKIKNNAIEFKLYFKNFEAQKEYAALLQSKNIVNAQEREKMGYQIAASAYQINEPLA